MRKGDSGGKKEKTDVNNGHYVIASSRPPERRTLVPITINIFQYQYLYQDLDVHEMRNAAIGGHMVGTTYCGLLYSG